MKHIKPNSTLLLLVFLFALLPSGKAQFYSGSQMEFGKSRVKYEDFFWTYYAYERYDVYFYEEGREFANYVSYAAKKQLSAIEKLFDYSINDRIQFLVYNKHTDFLQSNIGLSSEEQYNVGGVTRIVGSKVILYYEGDHARFDAQIRAGIAQVIINQMMYSGSTREAIKNSTLLNLPEWYIKGLIDFVANEWNSDIDSRVRDGIQLHKFKNINRLEGDDAVIGGHALWKYISDNYGDAVISNMLYMTKVTRNIDNSALFVVGSTIKNLWIECLDSYQRKYNDKDSTKKIPDYKLLLKPKPTRVYSQLKLSPDGENAVYVSNEMGQRKIWLYNFNTNKTKRIYKADKKIERINDYSFPLLAWHPSGKLFSYITERKGIIVLTTYELETKEKNARNIFNFEKILDYSYNDDGKKFVMSAVQKGQTDIFVFTAASNAYEQITKDIYDDLHPRFAHHSREIVFASNRPGDTIVFEPKNQLKDAQGNTDIFVYDYQSKSKTLKRVTATSTINENYPSDYDDAHISFLSDVNGVRNRYLAKFDTLLAYVDTSAHYKTVASYYPITNYSKNILEQDINSKSGKVAEIIYDEGKFKLFAFDKTKAPDQKTEALKNTSYREYKNKLDKKNQQQNEKTQILLSEIPIYENYQVIYEKPQPTADSNTVDINNYLFKNERVAISSTANRDKKTSSTIVDTIKTTSGNNMLTKASADEFQLGRQRNYNLNFSVDNVVSQLDNSFLNATYQRFTGGGSPVYLNPGLNALFKVGVSDLFEDYRIVGAMRFSGDLSSNEFLLSFENRVKHADHQLTLHRQAFLNVGGSSQLQKIHTQDVRYLIKFPLSEVSFLRTSVAYRNDRITYLATNDFNLRKPNDYENWATGKAELVFDNTIKKGLNLYNGTRAKLFGEYYRQLDRAKSDFFVLGFDARYYKKIHRCIIWANRIAASTSFGNEKLIYYMGGVDNWFGARFDNSTNIATDQNYRYQTLATNMRGFFQNARNGNSFAVINSELRIPFFKYIAKRPIRSDFVENFQIVTFGDLGTAWTGNSPYSDNNSFNTTIVANPGSPIEVRLNTQRNPIIGGYGIGIRSRLFGYFMRLDRAWGVQDGIIMKPITYFSLSLDF
jgi:hypothetical protein